MSPPEPSSLTARFYRRLHQYALLMRLHRPIGILLLLWPTLWALWLAADGWPGTMTLLVFVAGTVLMRSAGCVINDYADRNFDPHVARTKDRPLAAGRVTTREAITLFVVLALISFLLVLQTNLLTILLSIPAVLLAASYPFTKRFTHLPQAWLGAAFGWAVPMAYAAVQNRVPTEAWLLFLVTLLWALIYDTMYAMVDRPDDLKIGVKSSAILFGRFDRLIIGLLQVVMLLLLGWLGQIYALGLWFWLTLAGSVALFAWQQWLIRQREPAACFAAFLNNNWFGALLFAGIAAALVWR